MAGHGRRIDDFAVAGRQHDVRLSLGTKKYAGQVDVKHTLPLRQTHALCIHPLANAGVVDTDGEFHQASTTAATMPSTWSSFGDVGANRYRSEYLWPPTRWRLPRRVQSSNLPQLLMRQPRPGRGHNHAQYPVRRR